MTRHNDSNPDLILTESEKSYILSARKKVLLREEGLKKIVNIPLNEDWIFDLIRDSFSPERDDMRDCAITYCERRIAVFQQTLECLLRDK